MFFVTFLECYINTTYKCTALRVCCVVDTWSHRILFAACVNFRVVTLIACHAKQVVAGEVDTYVAYEDVLQETNKLLDDEKYYRQMADACNPYGDGKASERIVKTILAAYGYPVEKLTEFLSAI